MMQQIYGSRVLSRDDSHVYRLDGRVIPGLTTILKESGLVDTSYYTAESAMRGTHVHAATHYYDEDTLDDSTVEPEYRGFLEGYVSFRKVSGFEPVMIEMPVFHSLGYATTFDRVGWLNRKLVVLELKTGTVPKWVGLQTGGQLAAINDRVLAGDLKLPVAITARFAVELHKTGTFSLKKCEDREDPVNFLAVHRFLELRRRFT